MTHTKYKRYKKEKKILLRITLQERKCPNVAINIIGLAVESASGKKSKPSHKGSQSKKEASPRHRPHTTNYTSYSAGAQLPRVHLLPESCNTHPSKTGMSKDSSMMPVQNYTSYIAGAQLPRVHLSFGHFWTLLDNFRCHLDVIFQDRDVHVCQDLGGGPLH